jgi:hypothetical protein
VHIYGKENEWQERLTTAGKGKGRGRGTPLTLLSFGLALAFRIWIFRHSRPDPPSTLVMHDLSNPGQRKKRLFFSIAKPPLVDFFFLLVSESEELRGVRYRYRYGDSGSHRGYS